MDEVEMSSETPAATEVATHLQAFAARLIIFNVLASEALALGPADLVCMCLLQLHGSATPGWLAQKTGLTTGAITGVVDRLERAGYASRAPDPHDRRRLIVTPNLKRFAHDLQRNGPTPSPARLEFLHGYSTAEQRTIRRFVADLALAATPTD